MFKTAATFVTVFASLAIGVVWSASPSAATTDPEGVNWQKGVTLTDLGASVYKLKAYDQTEDVVFLSGTADIVGFGVRPAYAIFDRLARNLTLAVPKVEGEVGAGYVINVTWWGDHLLRGWTTSTDPMPSGSITHGPVTLCIDSCF